MKILLTAATKFELQPLLSVYKFVQLSTNLLEYKNNKNVVHVLITGIGSTAMAYHTGVQLQKEKYNLAINAGIAGSFAGKQLLGNVVEVTQEAFADLGAVEKNGFQNLIDLKLMLKNAFPFDNGFMKNKKTVTAFTKVKGITVNKIESNVNGVKALQKKYKAAIESMEGAGFFYACLHQPGLQFTEIRAISNYCGERDKKKWEMKTAITNLNNELLKIIF